MGKKRFPFVRGGVFDGLDEYRLSRPIKVSNKDIRYPVQESLFDDVIYSGHGRTTRLGTFFEYLSLGIYGGSKKEQQKTDAENGNGDLLTVVTEPDIVDERIFREVKSFSPTNTLKLYDHQMEKYAWSQLQDIVAPPIIRFELFRHGIRRLHKHKISSLDGFISDISNDVRFMISIPFSAAYAIYDNASVPNEFGVKKFPFTSRYEGDGYSWCTQFRPPGINNLLDSPKNTFKKIGLNPDEFEFEFRKFPKDVSINDSIIHPFPVLIIEEKDFLAQRYALEHRVKERTKRMKERNPYYDPLGLDAHMTENGDEEDQDVKEEEREYIPGWDF